jgi:hypothetical protein
VHRDAGADGVGVVDGRVAFVAEQRTNPASVDSEVCVTSFVLRLLRLGWEAVSNVFVVSTVMSVARCSSPPPSLSPIGLKIGKFRRNLFWAQNLSSRTEKRESRLDSNCVRGRMCGVILTPGRASRCVRLGLSLYPALVTTDTD